MGCTSSAPHGDGTHGNPAAASHGKSKKRGRASSAGDGTTGKTTKLEDDYIVSAMIGRGHYGSVYKGICRRTGRVVAIKMIDKAKSRPKRLQLEVKILHKIHKHPNVVALLDVYHTSQHVHLVLEFMSGGELFDRLVDRGPMDERQAATLCRKLASALRYMHKRGVVHRDLKPENILLEDKGDEANVKLADFGLSRFMRDDGQLMNTVCGTWAYSAPEVRIHRKGYDQSVDMWSLGVILFVVLSGYHPFDPEGNAAEEELQRAIKSGRFDFDDPAWDSVSDEARDLIRMLIRVSPNDRMLSNDVLRHPWIKRYTPRLHKRTPKLLSSAEDADATKKKKHKHKRKKHKRRHDKPSRGRTVADSGSDADDTTACTDEPSPGAPAFYSTAVSTQHPRPNQPGSRRASGGSGSPRSEAVGAATTSREAGTKGNAVRPASSAAGGGGTAADPARPTGRGSTSSGSDSDSDSSSSSDSSDSDSSDSDSSDSDNDDDGAITAAVVPRTSQARGSDAPHTMVRGAEPVRIMDMDSGEVVEGGDFTLIAVTRADSPGPRRGRKKRTLRRGRHGSDDPPTAQAHHESSHRLGRDVAGMLIPGVAAGGLGATLPGVGQAGAEASAMAAMVSDEVMVADNVALEAEAGPGGNLADEGGPVAGDAFSHAPYGGGGAGHGLMDLMDEGEVMSAAHASLHGSSEEVGAGADDVSGVMGRLNSGEMVSTLQSDDVDAAAEDARVRRSSRGSLYYDSRDEQGDGDGSAAFGYMDALVSGEEVAEDMGEAVGVGDDGLELAADGGDADPTGVLARLNSGEEMVETVDTSLRVVGASGVQMADGSWRPAGPGVDGGVTVDAAADAEAAAALARMASDEVVSEELEGAVDLSQMPNIFSRADHSASARAMGGAVTSSSVRHLTRGASGRTHGAGSSRRMRGASAIRSAGMAISAARGAGSSSRSQWRRR